MNRFELLRYERGLTRKDVARETGIHVRTLRALEEEDAKTPTAPVAKALADFYGITVPAVLGLQTPGARA